MTRRKQGKTYKGMNKALRRKRVKHSGEKMVVWPGKNSKVHTIPGLMPNNCFGDLGLNEMTNVKGGLLSHIVTETAGALCGKPT